MDISLDLYRVFRAATKAGSISKAARELYISQPAVSQAIRQLEERLGARLFTRSSKGITLTPEGEALIGYVEQACALIESAEKRMEQLKSLSGGEIRIGASDTLCKYYLLPKLEKFHRRYPDISIRVTNRTSHESLDLMRAGYVDMAFVNMPISAEGTEVRPCRGVTDCFVASSRYRHLTAGTLSWQDLAAQPLLLLEPLSNSRRLLDEFALSMGVTLRPEIELGSVDVMLDFAKIGLGIACVTREFVKQDIENCALYEINVSPQPPERHIGLATMRGVTPSFAAARFMELITG